MNKKAIFFLISLVVLTVMAFVLKENPEPIGVSLDSPNVLPVPSPTSSLAGVVFSDDNYDGKFSYSCSGPVERKSCLVEGGWIIYNATDRNGADTYLKIDVYRGKDADSVLQSLTCGTSCINDATGTTVVLPACGVIVNSCTH